MIGASFGGRGPWRTAPSTGDVGQLFAGARAAQQQAAAAHVAAADEVDRKPQPRAEHLGEDVDVLRRRDAAEQHDVAVGADFLGERARARDERTAIARIVGGDVDAGEARAARRPSRAVSAGRSPAFGVITSAPLPAIGAPGSGGRANASA